MYQCENYVHAEPGERCQAKPISELVLNTATCEIINKLCNGVNDNAFKKILKHINDCLGRIDYSQKIKDKIIEREKLDAELTFYLQQKMKSRDENERYYLDGKYQKSLKDINDLDAELRELEKKQMENEDIQDRLKTINKILNIGEITPDMLTIELTDAFIYKIIATSKRDAVF